MINNVRKENGEDPIPIYIEDDYLCETKIKSNSSDRVSSSVYRNHVL